MDVHAIDMTDAPTPILDLTYLADAADGDSEFISEILGDYLEEMDKQLVEIETLIIDEQFKTLIRSFHTIKGASANVGATRVRHTASLLESQANKGTIDPGQDLLPALRAEITEVKELITQQGVERLLKATG